MSRFDKLRTVIWSKARWEVKNDQEWLTDRAWANPVYVQMHSIQDEISARSRSLLDGEIKQPKDYQVTD